jgi:hypothetical protein
MCAPEAAAYLQYGGWSAGDATRRQAKSTAMAEILTGGR